jgi:GNAT superfamily N-acetyltransferase
MMDLLCLRPARASDSNFICSSWLKSYEMSPYARFMVPKLFYAFHKPILESILQKSLVVVAHSSDDSDQILGYIVYSPTDSHLYVHYCYVKQVYRNMGIASALFRRLWAGLTYKDDVIATHATDNFKFLTRTWPMLYNPYSIERFTK